MRAYDLHTWRVATCNHRTLVMKPTARTFGKRLAITFVCLLLVGSLAYSLYSTPKPGSSIRSAEFLAQKEKIDTMNDEMTRDLIDQGIITQEEVDAITQKSERRVGDARVRQDNMDRLFRTGIYCGISFFAFFAVLTPISVTWERVRFTTNVRGELVVRRRDSIGWPSKQYIPEDSIKQLFVIAREHREGDYKSGYRTVGWMWEVYAQGDNSEGLVVSVDLSPGRPLENRRLPENVQQVADTLSKFTGCTLRPGYAVTNIDSMHNSILGSHIRQSGTRRIEQTHTIEEPAGQPITYRAPNGAVYTYDTLEDMPYELQKMYRDLNNH